MGFAEYRSSYFSLSPEKRVWADRVSDNIWAKANIPPLFIALRFPEDWHGDEGGRVGVEQYLCRVDEFFSQGIGLHFFGESGRGKTFLATSVLKELIRSYDPTIPPYFRGAFMTFTDLVNLYTQGWYEAEAREAFDEHLRTVDYLVIDDLGKEFQGKANTPALDAVVRHRVYNQKPIIITTNCNLKEVEEKYGGGIVSLLQEACIRIRVVGGDFRRQKGEGYI